MPLASDWRWLLEREDTPWYPTMRLFRQRDLGDWDGVIERITAALREEVTEREGGPDIHQSAEAFGRPIELPVTASP
jgi:hypothetical protein